MIDWFPTPQSRDPARSLARWRGMIALRRTAREIDSLDPCTVGHSERVADIAADIARQLGWIRRRADDLHDAGLVHDVGKACVPASILLTPGTLGPADFEIVKVHATVGAEAAASVLSRRQAGWIRYHHERWDGRGYPDRLVEDEIPDGAAILCLADSWDAMTHRSWTGAALSHERALEECRIEAGRQFAPWAVAALERVIEARGAGRDAPPRATPRLRLVSAA